ncbi:ladderlectin-like isoform X2 [Sander lucioperca]|uniref:ladderlectin-like isoform X2 n=1 Tax=Sander lucioperca TaxID=283035 RepID=UPI00125D53F3|nr:ladderlectin-like isoform X2 [Sander lucioperca]
MMPEPVEEHVQVQQNNTGGSGELLRRIAGRMNKWQDYVTPSPYNDTGENNCPFDWQGYDLRCFIFIDIPMAWIDAENYCIQYGANLASIHNQGEYDFIQESLMTDGQAWIGGNNAVRTSAWLWSDGSDFDGNWVPPKPSRWRRCLAISRWSDYPDLNNWYCEKELPFVCGTRPPGSFYM